MGTGRTYNKAPVSRPKKSEGERARRVATQRKRLVARGMDEETVRKLNTKEIRELLMETAKTAAANA
ncbi:MAG: hypothetical protein HN341_04655 [Verrucomicrobia bacterium]|jgi:hypothetical protein|nr:hypothetical protein [Verrucomicrobiota bacterium]